MSIINEKNKTLIGKYWILFLLLGIFSVILGIYFMVNFGAGFEFIALMVSIYFLVTGIVSLFTCIMFRGTPGWGLNLFLSIVAFIAGILIFVDFFNSWTASVSEILIIVLCGIGMISESITLIAGSFAMKREQVSNWILTLILGIVLLVLSFIIIGNPLYSVALINIFVSIAVLVFGFSLITISLFMRRLRKEMKNQMR